METKFNFNSAICTSKAQSERLLALGLKKETADMRRPHYNEHTPWVIDERDCLNEHWLPSWSLHRLIDMMPSSLGDYFLIVNKQYVGYFSSVGLGYSSELFLNEGGMYECLIETIAWLIKEEYFNKEYLVDQEATEEHCKGVLEYLDYIRVED